MREASTPVLAELAWRRNTTDLLLERVRTAPDSAAFEVRQGPGTELWRSVSATEFHGAVRRLAKGLIAAGVRSGDRVAILADTRYEWAVADFACWFAGAVVVPIYPGSAPSQVAGIVTDAGVHLGLAGTGEQRDLLQAALAAGTLRSWSMDAAETGDLAALAALGAHVSDEELEVRRQRATPDSVATIVYTSGATGEAKGAQITHGNLLHQVLNVAAAYTEVIREGGATVIFLPLAHVLARALQLVCLANGMRIAHLSDPREVVPALARLRPTFLVVVPRVLQKIRAAVAHRAARLGPLWRDAERTAISWGRHLEAAQTSATRPPVALRLRHSGYERLFYRRIRTLFGGQLDYLLSGAAALDPELCRFFRGVGLPVLEGYGLTETCAPLTGNRPGSIRAGWVGTPIPGTTVRIGADGEVLAKGSGVFIGYHGQDTVFPDAFFHTGDVGELDAEGRLRILGRLKEVIVTSTGKTVAPAVWEQAMEQQPLVAHAVMVGESRPFLGGLVLLDRESLQAWAEREGVPELVQLPAAGELIELTHARLRRAVGSIVEVANRRVAKTEQARRFAVLLAGDSLVTPTLKLKRTRLIAQADAIIERLYQRD